MTSTDFRTMAATGELRLGTLVMEFTTSGIGDILKDAGCDFVFIDMEHGTVSFDGLKPLLKYFDAAGLPALVRPPTSRHIELGLALDLGAAAVSVPHLRGTDHAREILDSIRFPPDGSRGVALGIAHDRYRSASNFETMRQTNRRIAFYPTIEDIATVDEIEEIVALDGVDGVIVGHNDLSASMGIHGQYEHDRFKAAVARIAAACAQHGKSYVRVPFSHEDAVDLVDDGADMLIYGSDVWLLQSALTRGLTELRARSASRTDAVAAR